MIYLLLLLLIPAGYFGYKWEKERRRIKGIQIALNGKGIPKTDCTFTKKYTTPQGMKIDSVDEVPAKFLVTLDRAITDMVSVHRRHFPQWSKMNKPADYAIVFVKPGFVTVENDPGAGAIYVKGVGTAGTIIGEQGYSGADRCYIVLASQKVNNWGKFMFVYNAAYNEGEHADEFANDITVALSHVGAFDVHPHYI
jgi:hypothetical protein